MQNQATFQRTTLYIKPTFQRKMMIIMILLVTIASNLVGGLCYGLITWTLEDELLMESAVTAVDASQIPVLKQKIFAYIFPKIMLAEIVTIFLLFFLTLRLTHHIAGPVYRMEKNMTEMADGNLELRTFFRQRDEFSELAVALNTLADSYVERLKRIQAKVAMLLGSDVSAEQKKHLLEIQEELKTSPPKEPSFEEDFKAEKEI